MNTRRPPSLPELDAFTQRMWADRPTDELDRALLDRTATPIDWFLRLRERLRRAAVMEANHDAR